MSFKVKLHSYGDAQAGEFKKIGTWTFEETYKYTFIQELDPDQIERSNVDVIAILKDYILDIAEPSMSATYFPPTNQEPLEGDIMIPINKFKSHSDNIATDFNFDDIKSNIKNKIQEIVQLKRVLKEAKNRAEAAEAAAARANKQREIAEKAAARANEQREVAQQDAARANKQREVAQQREQKQLKKTRECFNEKLELEKRTKDRIKNQNTRIRILESQVKGSEGEGDLILSLDFDNLNQFGGNQIMAVKTDSEKPIDIKDEEGKIYRAYVGSVGSKFINMTENETKLNEAKTAVKQAQTRAKAAQAAQVAQTQEAVEQEKKSCLEQIAKAVEQEKEKGSQQTREAVEAAAARANEQIAKAVEQQQKKDFQEIQSKSQEIYRLGKKIRQLEEASKQ